MSKQTQQAPPRQAKAVGQNGQAGTGVKFAGTARRTIFINFPTASTVTGDSPFIATGTFQPNLTTMAPTAIIRTPNGDFVGNLNPNPPVGNNWSYEFDDILPQGVSLALIVTGTTIATGATETAVQPFDCGGP